MTLQQDQKVIFFKIKGYFMTFAQEFRSYNFSTTNLLIVKNFVSFSNTLALTSRTASWFFSLRLDILFNIKFGLRLFFKISVLNIPKEKND